MTLALHGDLSWPAMIGGFTLPALAGNIVGGTLLFALLSHAQVMHEGGGDGGGAR